MFTKHITNPENLNLTNLWKQEDYKIAFCPDNSFFGRGIPKTKLRMRRLHCDGEQVPEGRGQGGAP